MPETMRAIQINALGGIDELRILDLPVPRPREDEVLVRVAYAGVNPVDAKTRRGDGVSIKAFPAGLGWDFAGIVEQPDAAGAFLAGDAVFGMIRFPQHASTYAEYVAAPANEIVKAPANVDLRTAAATPMVALTAWQFLFEHGGLRTGQRVLVHGASGGVGHIAVQLAHHAGAKVIATASAHHHEFLRQLGAATVIDYRDPFEDELDGIDLALDTQGGAEFFRLPGVLRPGGTVISLLGSNPEGLAVATKRNVHARFPTVLPDGNTLAEISGLLAAGKLHVVVARVFAINDVAQAHELVESGHAGGRVVLAIDGDARTER